MTLTYDSIAKIWTAYACVKGRKYVAEGRCSGEAYNNILDCILDSDGGEE